MGKQQLTMRDRDCLKWIAEQFTVSTSDFLRVVNLHPQTRKRLGYDAVRMYVRRLRAAGFVATKQVTPALPHFIYVTPRTIEALALPFPEYEPRSLAEVDVMDEQTKVRRSIVLGKAIFHTDAINKARLYFEERYGDVCWRSERWIARNERQEPALKWEFRPDGQLDLHDQNTAVEVENAVKSKSRLDAILLFHLMTFERTYYFCTHSETYTLVKERVGELDPDSTHFQLIRKSEFM